MGCQIDTIITKGEYLQVISQQLLVNDLKSHKQQNNIPVTHTATIVHN